MSRKTLLLSVLVHVVVLASLLLASERRQARRRATAISMQEAKKEKPKPKEDKPPPPKPRDDKPKAPPKIEEARPVTPVAPPPSTGPAPIDTGLTMGNDDGPGIAVGGPRPGGASGPAGKPGGPATGPRKTGPAPRRSDSKDPDEECQEEAQKPVLVSTSPSLTDVYTSSPARGSGIEGKALFRIVVGADGSVMKVEVLKGLDPGLDAACVAAIEKWRFKPGTRCGKPVAGVAYNRAATFELAD